jgi:protein ImuA
VAVLGETLALPPIGLRRLQLAAEAGGGTALLLRPGAAAAAAAAWAVTRWQVGAVPGIAGVAAGTAVGIPLSGIRSRWRLELLRCRGGPAGTWVVEWCDETDRLALAAELRHRPAAPAAWHASGQPSARAG